MCKCAMLQDDLCSKISFLYSYKMENFQFNSKNNHERFLYKRFLTQ